MVTLSSKSDLSSYSAQGYIRQQLFCQETFVPYIKETGIRPMASMQNRGPLEHIWDQDVKFFSNENIIENDNNLVVISLSKVSKN